MIKQRNSYTGTVMTAAVLLMFAFVLRMIYEKLDNAMLQAIMSTVRNMIHLSLLFLWVVSLKRRLVNKNVRRLMLCVGALLLFWLIDKIVKWDFTGSEIHPLVRYLWYGFYVGMLFVPTLGAFIINYLGKPENYAHPKRMNVLLIPPTVMLTAVFTNDLHQKVFVFYNGFINFNLEYSYDWAYFIVIAWFIIMGFYFVIMMILKSRVPGSRRLQKMPVFIMIFAALFWIGYSMRLYNCDLTVMDCLIIVLLLESAIQSGLLPSNSNYQQIFDRTTVPVQIVDGDYKTHYISAAALPISESIMRRTEKESIPLDDYLVKGAVINGGHVIWKDDITRLNRLNKELENIREQLGEENNLLQAELDLKEKRARADEQNHLYDRIEREVEKQLMKADELLQKIEAEPDNTRSLFAQICVLGAYIKRRGNLLLLGEETEYIDIRELEYCIRESLENLRLGQVFTSFNCSCDGKMPLEHIIAVYDFYEKTVEWLLDDITAMMVDLTCCNGRIKLNLQIGCKKKILEHVPDDIFVPYGKFSYDIMEEDAVMNLTVGAGGCAV